MIAEISSSYAAPLLAAVGVIVVGMMTRRTGKAQTKTADWSAFSERQAQFLDQIISERDTRIASLEKGGEIKDQEVAKLRADVDDLRRQFQKISEKYWIAIDVIRWFFAKWKVHFPDDPVDIPPEIAPDL